MTPNEIAQKAGEAAWEKMKDVVKDSMPRAVAYPFLALLESAKNQVVSAAVDAVAISAPGVEITDLRTEAGDS